MASQPASELRGGENELQRARAAAVIEPRLEAGETPGTFVFGTRSSAGKSILGLPMGVYAPQKDWFLLAITSRRLLVFLLMGSIHRRSRIGMCRVAA